MSVVSKVKIKEAFTMKYSRNELINVLEKFQYFEASDGSQYLDYEKVMLFFVLYSQSNSLDQETFRKNLLFNML